MAEINKFVSRGLEINLMDLYPRIKRNLDERSKVNAKDRAIARKFGKEFFDGTRDQGYGGYRYDGRWVPIVKRMIEHYSFPPNASILDVGCGKGFMLHDFKAALPLGKIAGIDISDYAITNAMEDVKNFVEVGDCRSLPYDNHSFDLVISINTVHDVPYKDCVRAVAQIERVGRKHKFIVVDAYRNDEEKERIFKWNLTAKTILHTDDWKKLFAEAGYTGDYYWFIP